MKEFKGTKGDWVVDFSDDFNSDDALITSTYRVGMIEIAKVQGAHPDSGFDDEFRLEQEANSKLISAAPCLLSAIQHLVEAYDSEDGKQWTTSSKKEAIAKARAAIDKALGE